LSNLQNAACGAKKLKRGDGQAIVSIGRWGIVRTSEPDHRPRVDSPQAGQAPSRLAPIVLDPQDAAADELVLLRERIVAARDSGAVPVVLLPAHVESVPAWISVLGVPVATCSWTGAEMAEMTWWSFSDDDGVVEVRLGAEAGVRRVKLPQARIDALWGNLLDPISRRDMVSWAVLSLVGLLGLVILIGAFVPAPYVVEFRQQGRSVDALVEVPDPPQITGDFEFGLVSMRQIRWSELPVWLYREGRDTTILPVEYKVGGTDNGVGKRLDAPFSPEETVRTSIVSGTVAAARLAGRDDIDITGSGAHVISSAPPPMSDLVPGDLIVEAEGRPVKSLADVDAVVAAAEPGSMVSVRTAAGEDKSFWIRPAPHASLGRVTAAQMETLDAQLVGEEMPKIHRGGVFGPSAGLAVALYQYQRYAGVDLVRGRKIMATGAISPSGDVLPVGGVPHKVLDASERNFDIVLAPRTNMQVATMFGPYVPGIVRVFPVDTLAEAVEMLSKPTGEELCPMPLKQIPDHPVRMCWGSTFF
jgi:PDZ domain-containing secreted protein